MTTPQLTKPILRSDDSANMNGLDKGRLDIQLSNIDLLSKQLREGKFDSFRETISNIPPELLDIDLPDRHGRYLIFMACSLNHIPTVKILMEHNCTLSVHQLNKTVLEVVLQSGYHELLDLLLKYDKKTLGHSVVNIVGENAPLHIALHYGEADVVQKLLHHGADPWLMTVGKIKTSKGDIVEYVETCAWAVGNLEDPQLLKLIIESLDDLNRHTTFGITLLLVAAINNKTLAVKILLEHGADPNKPNQSNYSPLQHAIESENKEMVELLLSYGSDPNHQNSVGNTPFHVAVISRNMTAVRAILDAYPLAGPETSCTMDRPHTTGRELQCNICNYRGYTPLAMLLRVYGRFAIQVTRQMLPYTSPNLQSSNRNTILHYISRLDIWDQLEDILITMPLNIHVENSKGETPLSLAMNRELVLRITSQSYYYQLVQAPGRWLEEWQLSCSLGLYV